MQTYAATWLPFAFVAFLGLAVLLVGIFLKNNVMLAVGALLTVVFPVVGILFSIRWIFGFIGIVVVGIVVAVYLAYVAVRWISAR
jgi:hypothetical protein